MELFFEKPNYARVDVRTKCDSGNLKASIAPGVTGQGCLTHCKP